MYYISTFHFDIGEFVTITKSCTVRALFPTLFPLPFHNKKIRGNIPVLTQAILASLPNTYKWLTLAILEETNLHAGISSTLEFRAPGTFAYESHMAAVFSADASPIHHNLFVTSSMDTTLRIYSLLQVRFSVMLQNFYLNGLELVKNYIIISYFYFIWKYSTSDWHNFCTKFFFNISSYIV